MASYKTLVHIFERIHFFVQRLNSYTGIPLTKDLTELLGKIMAQVLSILGLSTKAMTERRTSESVHGLCSYLADYGSEKFLKRLIGRTDVEDALLRLDSLTREESLMAVAKNLEVTHYVDGNVKDIKVLTEDIDGNVKAVKERTQSFLILVAHGPTLLLIMSKQERMSNNVRHSSMVPSLAVEADTRSQGTGCKRSFKDGSLLPNVPSIITMHARSSMMELERGLLIATNFENGRRTVLCCGSVAIVRFSRQFCVMAN